MPEIQKKPAYSMISSIHAAPNFHQELHML